MEHTKGGEKDMFSGEEPHPKRHKGDPTTAKGKSVVILLDTDVIKNEQEVFMPNTIEMAKIKKKGKGRFKTNISFTREMTERDVRSLLLQNFPFLRNKTSIRCASASDNRSKLNFHGEPRLWNGELIRRLIKGNSALYLLVEGSNESSEVPDNSQVLRVPIGTVSVAATRPFTETMPTSGPHQQNQLLYTHDQHVKGNPLTTQAWNMYNSNGTDIFSRNTQHSLEQGVASGKTTACQWGIFPNQFMLLTGKQKNGTDYDNPVTQADTGHIGKSTIRQQPALQLEIPSEAVNENSRFQVNSAASQLSVNQLQVPETTTVQHQAADFQDKTPKWGSPSTQILPDSVPQDALLHLVATQLLTELSKTSSSANQGHVTGKGDALSSDVLSQQKHLPMLQTEQHRSSAQEGLPTVQLSSVQAWSETDDQLLVNQRKQSSSGKESYAPGQPENVAHELVMAVANNETLDSAYESAVEDNNNVAHGREKTKGSIKIVPSSGFTEGGDEFVFMLHERLPDNATSYEAIFEDCGPVTLEKTNPYGLTGLTPKSQSAGLKNVTLVLKSPNGSWKGGTTSFTYIDKVVQTLAQMVDSKDAQSAFFELMSKSVKIESSDVQSPAHSGATETGLSNLSESTNVWSVKVLKVLVYKAAQIGGHEFLQMIFSTSAGKVVFSSYKNNAVLPEDVSRKNGHTALADYLHNVTNRLSNEGDKDAINESIDWLELKHAVDKEHSLACTEDVQTLKKWQPLSCPESDDDDDESEYFADGEASAASSPLRTKVFYSYNGEGTNEGEVLNRWQTANCSDHDDDDDSSYSGDNESSSCSSPSHSEVSDSGEEDGSQNTKEPGNAVLKQEHFSEPPLNHTGNKLEFLPPTKADSAFEHIQLVPGEVDSQGTEDDMVEKNQSEYNMGHADSKTDQNDPTVNTFPDGSELVDWTTFEVKSMIPQASTRTSSSQDAVLRISSHQETERIKNRLQGDIELGGLNTLKSEVKSTAAEACTGITRSLAANISSHQETDDAKEASEDSLGGDQKEFMKMEHGETTTSKDLIIMSDQGNKKEKVIADGNLRVLSISLGEYGKATEYLEKALAMRKDIGDRAGEISSYGNLGTMFISLGEYFKAKKYLKIALTISKEIGDRAGEISSYGNLGTMFISLGEYFKAKKYLKIALTISKEIGDREGEASGYGNLGTVFHSLGEHTKAKEYLEKALTVRIEIGDRAGEASCYGNLGTMFISLGEYFKAKKYLKKALAISKEIVPGVLYYC